MSSVATADSRPQSFKDVWLIAAGHGLTHWYTATFYVLLPLIGKELGLSYSQIGLIMTIQHVAGAIANLPGGVVVDIVGQKGYLMAASLFWVGVPYAFMAGTHDFWMLLVCVTLVGIGNNIWHPAAIPTLAYRYPKRKGLVLSFHGMGGNIGEAIAPVVIGVLLGMFTWRETVVINVIPGVTMAVLILLMLGAFEMSRGGDADAINAKGRKHSLKEYVSNYASLLRNKALMIVAFSSSCRTMVQSGLLTFLPVFLAYELQYSTVMVGLCLTVIQVAGFIAGPIGGHLSDKLGRRRVVMSSMLLSGVMVVGMVLAGRTPFFVVFIALVGFFLYAMRAVLQAWALETTPKELAGSAVGIQFGITSLGGGLSPLIFGVIADAYGLYTGFYFLAGLIIFANVLVFFIPNDPARTAAAASRA